MISARRTFTAGLTLLAAVAWGPARAQAPSAAAGVTQSRGDDGAGRSALVAERQRVRAELERTNADIDALKRSGRSLRDDYRLRARLADAEALARRLTALDARLGGGAGPLPDRNAAGTEPRALPTDGPAELDAKADILNDQSRRLAARGDALLARAHDLRARQNLRRRVGQMERDPFSPLEGSKRRAMASSTVASADPTRNGGSPGGGTTGNGPTFGDTKGTTPSAPNPPTTTPTTTQPGSGAAAPPPGSSTSVPVLGGAQAPGAGPATSTGTGSSAAVSAPKLGPTPATTGTPTTDTALSVQLRDLLDPTTLAELQRLEATGGTMNGYEALERAGAALKARADRLGQQAASLRARAH